MQKLSTKFWKIKFNHTFKRSYHDQVEFILWMQAWFKVCKSINVIHHLNSVKSKSYMVISINVGKHLTRFNTFHNKTLNKPNKLGIEENYLNIIMAIYEKPIAIIMVKDSKLFL